MELFVFAIQVNIPNSCKAVHIEQSPSIRICEKLFRQCKTGNSNVEDDRNRKSEDGRLQKLLMIPLKLNNYQKYYIYTKTINKPLRAMRNIHTFD